VFITSCPDNSGTAIGAALWLHAQRSGTRHVEAITHNYWGPGYSDEDCLAVARKYNLSDAEPVADPAVRVAQDLAEGMIIGWFQGRMEFGQRALGNRSILLDPRRKDGKAVGRSVRYGLVASLLVTTQHIGLSSMSERLSRSRWGKQVMDVTGASLGLVLSALPMLLIALLILVTMGRPILFRQTRPGLQRVPFDIVKIRTMRCPAGGLDGFDEAARLTPLGRLLRSLSLDELPEFWNVLTGEMSLVGPRPLLMEYLNLYSPEQARR